MRHTVEFGLLSYPIPLACVVIKRYDLCLKNVKMFFFLRESGEETCNFRQFVKTLAHFRPFDSSKENPLNTREKKLKCKLALM